MTYAWFYDVNSPCCPDWIKAADKAGLISPWSEDAISTPNKRQNTVTKHSDPSRQHNPAVSPLPKDIKGLRLLNNLTQTEAAAKVYRNCRCWQRWESGGSKMDPAIFELFVIKLNFEVENFYDTQSKS